MSLANLKHVRVGFFGDVVVLAASDPRRLDVRGREVVGQEEDVTSVHKPSIDRAQQDVPAVLVVLRTQYDDCNIYRDLLPSCLCVSAVSCIGNKNCIMRDSIIFYSQYMILPIHKDTMVIISLSYNLKLNTTCFEKRNLLSKQ